MMEFTTVDYVLSCVIAGMTLIGLIRGLSGELGSIAGFGAALGAGWSLHDAAHTCAVSLGFAQRGDSAVVIATGVIDFVFALLAFGVVRWTVAKFVSFLVPQPTNALLGGLGGILKGVVLVAFLMGVGFVDPGQYASSYVSQRSVIVRDVASWVDSMAEGRIR